MLPASAGSWLIAASPHQFSGGQRSRIVLPPAPLRLSAAFPVFRRVRRWPIVLLAQVLNRSGRWRLLALTYLFLTRPGGDPARLRPSRGPVLGRGRVWQTHGRLYAHPNHPYTEGPSSSKYRASTGAPPLLPSAANSSRCSPSDAFSIRCPRPGSLPSSMFRAREIAAAAGPPAPERAWRLNTRTTLHLPRAPPCRCAARPTAHPTTPRTRPCGGLELLRQDETASSRLYAAGTRRGATSSPARFPELLVPTVPSCNRYFPSGCALAGPASPAAIAAGIGLSAHLEAASRSTDQASVTR